MRLGDAMGLAAANIRNNPVRSMLTILGLGVGVGAILTVLTLGNAGQEQVETEIARLGVDKVWITEAADSTRGLALSDAAAVEAATGSPVCAGAYTMAAVSAGEHMAMCRVSGYDSGVEAVHHPVMEEGRMFTRQEYADAAPVAVVDRTLADDLGGDVIGRRISVGNRRVRVVGVTAGMAVQSLMAGTGTLMLPIRTLLDTWAESAVEELTVAVPRGIRAESVGETAVAALTAQGGRYDAASLQEEIDAARSVIRIFVMVLTCVAAVCMLVGGIGVMNILLVGVRERRKEIGLLKAVGGTSRQVAVLFLLEAVCFSLLGGVLGLVLGIMMIRLFGAWIGLNAMLRWSTAIPALLGAALLGVVFGVAPAMRAARLPPVDALRME